MDDGASRERGRHHPDYYKGTDNLWNAKMAKLATEKEAAIRDMKIALAEKKQALAERDAAFDRRDEAINERNNAINEMNKARMERDNAIEALNYYKQWGSFGATTKRSDQIIDAFPISFAPSEPIKSSAKRTKEKDTASYPPPPTQKRKKVNKDLNKQVGSNGIKMKSEWDIQELGLNLVTFDESTMPAPVCSCTGLRRQCYKWGNGGWQSSCCTTTLSEYPLPQMPNRRHARMGGRKMSGSVFTRLLSRMAAAGHDLSIPVDLKEYWARHGSNRYIVIK